MERLALCNEYSGDIWLLEKGIPKELITEDDDYYSYIKKLADYEDAEEQGLLLRLPCKVGDAVYFFLEYGEGFCITKAEVKRIELLKSVMGNIRYLVEPVSRRGILFKYYDDEFGRRIFLTQESAEQALKEMEDKNAY